MNNNLDKQELQFLIDLSEEKRKEHRYNGDNIKTENTSIHSVGIYHIIQKLKNLLNK